MKHIRKRIRLKTPRFWQSKNPASTLLLPVAAAYAGLGWLKEKSTKPVRVDIPVICVGNASLGGAGKTPFCLMLLDLLRQNGMNPHILLRGYGGTVGKSRQVTATDTVGTVGDEALVYASKCATWVGGDRAASARLAQAKGAGVLIMDDGFQNPGLKKDLNFLLIDVGSGGGSERGSERGSGGSFGNFRWFPAGPLREPLARSFARANALVLTSADTEPRHDTFRSFIKELARKNGRPTPLETGFHLTAPSLEWLAGKSVVAFAGIARPEKFFQTLRASTCTLVMTRAYGDHHLFTQTELEDLQTRAKASGARLVTTEKDHVRLPAEWQKNVRAISGQMRVTDRSQLDLVLKPIR